MHVSQPWCKLVQILSSPPPPLCYQLLVRVLILFVSSDNLGFVCLATAALKALLRCVTGSPYFKGNAMRVVFSNYEEGFRFGTCGGVMTISTRISDQEMFMLGVKTLIDSRSFTMP